MVVHVKTWRERAAHELIILDYFHWFEADYAFLLLFQQWVGQQ
jgi:hypothetical protein